jgi:hypothetical protein
MTYIKQIYDFVWNIFSSVRRNGINILAVTWIQVNALQNQSWLYVSYSLTPFNDAVTALNGMDYPERLLGKDLEGSRSWPSIRLNSLGKTKTNLSV